MLINLKEILKIAEEGEFAIPAFNVYNMETVIAVIRAAEECRAPVILQAYSRLFTSNMAYYLAPLVLKVAQDATVPVCFHIDHGAGYPEITKAVRYGTTGVMIDASTKSLEENIAITQKVSAYCNPLGIPVEGELGHIGIAANGDENAEYTHVDEALKYVQEAQVSALAIMVGTAHGRYKKTPQLAIDRIREIKEAVKIPLVLHGGSGVPDDQIQAAIAAGIRKINFSTDLCYTFVDAIFESDRSKIAIDLFMQDAIAKVQEFVTAKIKLLGAENRI